MAVSRSGSTVHPPKDGPAMSVVLPYEDFLELTKEDDDESVTLPAEVVDIVMDGGKSLIRA